MMEENDVGRLDSTYFLKHDVANLQRIQSLEHSRIGDLCYVTDGIHTSIDFEEGSGIKVISAKHPKSGFLDLSSFEEISAESHAANPRTALREEDLLISTVGTIGNAAVVRREVLPANSDRHVGIIRTLPSVQRPISPEYLSVFLNSAYGRMQSHRETTGNVQPNLFLVKIRDIKVVRLSLELETKIHELSLRSLAAFRSMHEAIGLAERVLLESLGFADWTPPEPLTYNVRASEVFAAGRLDPQYFMPPKEKVRRALAGMPGLPLSERAESVRELWAPDRACPTVQVRNYDVTDALVPLLDATKEPSSPIDIGSMKKVFKDGDVVISRLRAYLKEVAVVRIGDKIPSVGSSEFIVLRPRHDLISPEALMVFLCSKPVQTILKWCQDGSQHPRFSEADLLSIHVPDTVLRVSAEITKIVQEGFAARGLSRKLLMAGTHAVEIAIEKGESSALRFLNKIEESL